MCDLDVWEGKGVPVLFEGRETKEGKGDEGDTCANTEQGIEESGIVRGERKAEGRTGGSTGGFSAKSGVDIPPFLRFWLALSS